MQTLVAVRCGGIVGEGPAQVKNRAVLLYVQAP